MIKASNFADGQERSFHTDCFKCGCRSSSANSTGLKPGCGKLLDPGQQQASKYFVKEDVIYCQQCNDTLFAAECAGCHQKILSEDGTQVKSIKLKEKSYHTHCFKCHDCSKVFEDYKAYMFKDEFYCLEDYNKHSQVPRVDVK